MSLPLTKIAKLAFRSKSDPTLTLLRTLLPQPLQGDNPIIAGDPGELIAVVHREGVTIYEYSVVWRKPYQPEVYGDERGVLTHPIDVQTLKALITRTRQLRRRKYRRCMDCGEKTPPEWMGTWVGDLLGQPLCHRCMEQRGVKF